jgi:2-C-methyl-D-erythritol 2,4-cyclodiphosphate synthase
MEKPKIFSFIQDMKNTISTIVETEPDNVAVKATTTEKLGFIGREEGVFAIAVVLLSK